MPMPSLFADLQTYSFLMNADAAAAPAVYIDCFVTDTENNTQQSINFFYSPANHSGLQGIVTGTDASWGAFIFSNSALLLQTFLWALKEQGTKHFYISGTPDPGTGSYPYTVTYFDFQPTEVEPGMLALVEGKMPEITADIPLDMRRAIERYRGLQQRLRRRAKQ